MGKKEHNLEADDFVKAIVEDTDKPHGVVCVNGFIGKSSQDDCIRIYLDVNLTSCFDLKKDAIVHVERIPKSQNSLGGAYVWYKAVNMEECNNQQHSTEENQFFQGNINNQYQQAQYQQAQNQQAQYQTYPPFCIAPSDFQNNQMK